MDWLVLALGGVVVAFMYAAKGGSVTEDVSADAGPEPSTDTYDGSVKDAIWKGITRPLGLPAVATSILFAQAVLETGHFKADYLSVTQSLFNRHIGSGRGDWKGAGKAKSALQAGEDFLYVSPGDPDLRCYDDFYQSARDMAQLLQDGLYAQALAALRRGSPTDYFNALRAAGFSTQDSYASALQRTYAEVS